MEKKRFPLSAYVEKGVNCNAHENDQIAKTSSRAIPSDIKHLDPLWTECKRTLVEGPKDSKPATTKMNSFQCVI